MAELPKTFTVELTAAELGILTALASQWMRDVGSFSRESAVVSGLLCGKLFDAFDGAYARKAAEEPHPRG